MRSEDRMLIDLVGLTLLELNIYVGLVCTELPALVLNGTTLRQSAFSLASLSP